MSTKGIRDFRPKLHFTTPKGWINDPNGLVFYGGKYHLFYQHHPHDTCWGPMHWGHAVSDNLIQWEHLPIALYPDEDGTIFSGSAVADTNNVSGLQKKDGEIPIIAFYTSHGEQEVQSIAYSYDAVNFTKYEKNPVIENPGIPDFRDPKMFWNPIRDCWSMVLAAGDRLMFYASDNLLNWEKTGEFGNDKNPGNHAHGVWECPDMIPFKHENKTIWLLLASMGGTPEKESVMTQYFLGDFDGDKFICTYPFGYVEQLDSGWDNYAGVTYSNIEPPTFIGWATCGKYADKTPTGDYCCTMTLPRVLSIEKTSKGPRLATFPTALEGNFCKGTSIEGETFMLRIEGMGACCVALTNDAAQVLKFGVDSENQLFIDRSKAGAVDFSEHFASDTFSIRKAERFYDGVYSLEFIFDVSIAELFVDKGTRSMSMVCYPDTPYTNVSVSGDAKMQIYNLK